MDGTLAASPDLIAPIVRAIAPVMLRLRAEIDDRFADLQADLVERIANAITENRRRAEDEIRQAAEAMRTLADTVNAMTQKIPDQISLQIAMLPRPRDGRDGYLGAVSDYTIRVYEAGECCRLLGGLWQAIERTNSEPTPDNSAWRVVAEGICDFFAGFDEDDPRRLTWGNRVTGGNVHQATLDLPLPLHRGAYASDHSYVRNDIVAIDGGSFICVAEQATTPPPSDEWRLVAQRGSRGKVGPRGERGEPGPQGMQGPSGPDTRAALAEFRRELAALKEIVEQRNAG